MKRPSGFDSSPEPGLPDADAPQALTPASGDGVEETPRPSLLRRRIAALADAAGSNQRADEPRGGVADPSLAPTVDLSEVREAREAAELRGEAEVDPVAEPGGVEPAARDIDGADRFDLVSAEAAPRFSLARLRASQESDPVRAAERRLRQAERQHRAQLRSESRRFSAESRRRRRNWLIALAAVGALALFVVAGAFTPIMAVREVQVVGTVNVNPADVQQALARFDGRPLALVDDAEVHRALEPFPMIQHYAVERVPPHTLLVRIEERVPVISVQGDAGFAVFDSAGVLLASAETPPAGAPVGVGAVTDFSSEAFRSAGRALRDMPDELRAQVVSVTASSGQDVSFTLSNGIEVLWGDADRTRYKAEVLARMLVALADRGVEYIDVSSADAPVFR
ncbi:MULTISPECIES: FtsQ-type POTRA domain-containing protein [unclassified Leucobacter]|uniref:FtsQ-type POTRA domain-containing protein n=1 Tax=unclassified Leucobacter TaxID=2621730 RepID=UPI00301700C1